MKALLVAAAVAVVSYKLALSFAASVIKGAMSLVLMISVLSVLMAIALIWLVASRRGG